MRLSLTPIKESELKQYKLDMQRAFQLGAKEGGFPIDDGQILPESHIDRSLNTKGAIAYKAVDGDQMVGGAIIVLNNEKSEGHLDFLYVKHGVQSKGIGKFIWFEIEKLHPNIKLWKTCTPHFEKRNIHFYLNVCHFCATEFFSKYHRDPNAPDDTADLDDDGMLGFEKVIK